MRTERAVLYGDVVAGEVATVEELRERLATIEALEESEDERPIDTRVAIRAFEALRSEAPSRHHQLEILREALGLA
jgi:hypothetical protein